MQISLVDKQSGKKHQGPLQKRFEKLHKQLDRQKRLNERFERELDELTNTYRHHTREANHKQLDTLIALATKLITFARRKSLSEWHRNEIRDWTEDLVIHRITPLDPETAEQLHNQYEESIAHLLGLTTEQFRAHCQEAFSNESKEETAEGLEEEAFQDDLFGFDDTPPDPDDWFREPEEKKPQHDEILDDFNLRGQVMDSAWLKTLFRRAAQHLHPDREPDTEKRRHKQQQLSELLSARKENDILTMLKIYSETLNGQEIQLAENEMTTICDLLEDEIENLKLKQAAYIHSHPERQLAYEFFYHSNKKKRQEAMKLLKEELAQESKQNRELVDFLRNLTNLKEVLHERRIQRVQVTNWIMDDYDIW